MRQRLWLKISHLILRNWWADDEVDGGRQVCGNLVCGDFQLRLSVRFDVDGSFMSWDFESVPARAISRARYLMHPQRLPDFTLEEALAKEVHSFLDQPENLVPLQLLLKEGIQPAEMIVSPLSWGDGRVLWVPVDFIELYHFEVNDRGSWTCSFRFGHHLTFFEQYVDLSWRPSQFDINQYRRVETNQGLLSWRTLELMAEALELAFDEGLPDLLDGLRANGGSDVNTKYLYTLSGIDPDGVIPGLVLSEHEPAPVVF